MHGTFSHIKYTNILSDKIPHGQNRSLEKIFMKQNPNTRENVVGLNYPYIVNNK